MHSGLAHPRPLHFAVHCTLGVCADMLYMHVCVDMVCVEVCVHACHSNSEVQV